MNREKPNEGCPWRLDKSDHNVPDICLTNHHAINVELQNPGSIQLYSSWWWRTQHLRFRRLPRHTHRRAYKAISIHGLCHSHLHRAIFKLTHCRDWRGGPGEGALCKVTVEPCWYWCLAAKLQPWCRCRGRGAAGFSRCWGWLMLLRDNVTSVFFRSVLERTFIVNRFTPLHIHSTYIVRMCLYVSETIACLREHRSPVNDSNTFQCKGPHKENNLILLVRLLPDLWFLCACPL